MKFGIPIMFMLLYELNHVVLGTERMHLPLEHMQKLIFAYVPK